MKTEKRKTLHGSVLFTVVCVMALLIIFLTGTLALASASTNRAHKSYSSSQANYTARATIESFLKAMEREPGIPAAIENLTTDPIYASVVINDKTLGQVGCYQSGVWTPDVIEIAPDDSNTKDQYVYADTKKDGDWKWIKVTGVKVTAVCRVGKEEETVTAYIRKSPGGSSKTTPGGIRGLQEVGGNAFPNGALITGGLGVGIANDSSGMYAVHNSQEVETSVSFINGTLITGTGSSVFRVKAPTDNGAATPYSQTVIMGNLWMRNNNFMEVNYDFPSSKESYTEKDVPYLYIDGTIDGNNPSLDVVTGDGVGPFNIFVGTIDGRKDETLGIGEHAYSFGNADLYLMDEPTVDDDGNPETIRIKYPGDRDFAEEEMSEENDPRSDDLKAKDRDIVKGMNYLGTSMGSNTLYSWTSSCVNRTAQFKSHGGNIFCNGDLTIQNFSIDGDLRVKGNCTIGNNVNVSGKIVVGGKLTVNDTNFKEWNKVYCDTVQAPGETNADIPVLQEGYTEHVDELISYYYSEIHNFVYENEPIPEDLYEVRRSFQDSDDGWRWHIQYPGDDEKGRRISEENDGWGPNGAQFQNYELYVITDDSLTVEETRAGSSVPRYRTGPDGFATNTVTFKDSVIYKADPSDPSKVYEDETGNSLIIDNEYSYYRKDDEGKPIADQEVGRDTAYGTFYLYEGDPKPRSEDEAKKVENVTTHPYVEFGQPAYPECMTREAIYGSGDSIDEFEVNAETKIVKNLLEMRNDLKLDAYGDYDTSTYPVTVPEEEWDDSVTEGVREGVYQLPYAFNSDGSKNTDVWDGDYIVKSCVIGNTDGASFALPGCVKIKPTNTIWVVLRNVNFNEGDGNDYNADGKGGDRIFCNTEKGTVKFMIDGTLHIGKGGIVKEGMKDGYVVTPKTKWNIEYYGTKPEVDPEDDTKTIGGSDITLGNNVTFCGTFMCPETTISANVAGFYTVKYTDEYGATRNDSSPIIGSALFKKVRQASNNFGVLNSGGGGADGENETIETVFGTYEISYFMGV